jgi:hypothetical protein
MTFDKFKGLNQGKDKNRTARTESVRAKRGNLQKQANTRVETSVVDPESGSGISS